jgi:tetratricopeptide (TPR) repeat protein
VNDAHDGVRPQTGLPAHQQIGRYRIERILGRGGMSVVYAARDAELGRLVALKVLRTGDGVDDRTIERFHREAQNAARLQHPNIVTIYEAGRQDDLLYIAAELVDGLPLDEWRTQKNPSRDVVLGVIEQVARAVQVAHDHGIIHRDLKPGNILVDADGRPRIVDFGLSRAADRNVDVTRSGVVIGTPAYMAPEQARGDVARLDTRTDVYALGVILYEILAGRLPHWAPTIVELCRKIILDDPPPPRHIASGVPLELDRVATKAIEKEPRRRYDRAADFAEDLRRARAGEPVTARPASSMRLLWRFTVRHRSVAVPLLTAVLVAGAFGAWMAAQRGRAPTAPRDEAAALRLALSQLETARGTIDAADDAHYDAQIDLVAALARVEDAIRQIEAVVARTPELAVGHFLLGRAWELRGWSDRAEASWRRALAIDPGFAAARYRLGRLLMARAFLENIATPAQGRMPPFERTTSLADEARRELEAALAAGFDEPVARDVAAAMAAFLKGDYATVDTIAAEGLRRHEGRRGIEELHWIAGHIFEDRARRIRIQTQALAMRPRFALAAFSRALAHHDLRRWREAIDDYTLALSVNPRILAALSNRAVAHHELGDHDACLADCNAVLQIDPRYVNALCNRALGFAGNGDLHAAVAACTEALAVDPQCVAALVNRGRWTADQGDRDAAMRDFTAAIEAAPGRAEAWLSRGNLRLGAGDLSGAMDDYEGALRADPQSVRALTNRGVVRLAREDLAGARADFDAAIRIEPSHADAWCNRSVVRARTRDAEGCVADATEAIRLNDRLPDAYSNRGLGHRALGRRADAIADFRKALSLAPAEWKPRADVERALRALE